MPDIDGFGMIRRKFPLKFSHSSPGISRKHPNLPIGAETFERGPGSTGGRFAIVFGFYTFEVSVTTQVSKNILCVVASMLYWIGY